MEISLERIENYSITYISINVISHYCVSIFLSFPHFFDIYEHPHFFLQSPLYCIFFLFGTYFAWNVVYNLKKTITNSKHSKIVCTDSDLTLNSSQNDQSPRHRESARVNESSQVVRQRRQIQSPSWCDACLVEKPARAHHCKICKVCVLRRDHHCYVLGECIGLRNQGHFILFLLHAAFSLCFSSTFFLVYVNRIFFNDFTLYEIALGQYYLFPLNLFRWLLWRDFSAYLIFISLFLCASLLNAVVCGAYGLLQLFLVLKDETSYEFWKRTRGGEAIQSQGRNLELSELGEQRVQNVLEKQRYDCSYSLTQCFGRRWGLVLLLPFLLVPPGVMESRVKEV